MKTVIFIMQVERNNTGWGFKTIKKARRIILKLDNPQSIFNMGDTSIRVKQLVEVNRLILKHTKEYMGEEFVWERNATLQEDFYKSFIDEIVRLEEKDGIELFSDFKRAKNYKVNSNKLGMRGRTLTNALMKTGLISSKRKVSNVGQAYLDNSLSKPDQIEEILGLSEDNLVYLRQYLKLRIYSSNSDDYFYNFRFALLFLSKFDNVPQQDFLKIIESIKPGQSSQELFEIIKEYQTVLDNNETFEEYYERMFISTLRPTSTLKEVRQMFIDKDFSDANFIKYFENRDSNSTSLLYKKFVLLLLDFSNKPSISLMSEIEKLSKNAKIKKAFGEGKIPFRFKRNMSLSDFIEENSDNKLLSKDGYQIYLQFIFSKHNDLIREYSDMCRRTFQITGLISFDNGLVNLNNKWIIAPLLDLIEDKFVITGEDSYSEYEINENSFWFANNTMKDILAISDEEISLLFNSLGERFGTTELSSINNLIEQQREQEYREFIENHFPVEKVTEILEYIKIRDDQQVFNLVTESATIPTIFEYILTIAWYYISKDKEFFIHKTFQVSLDGSKLPLTHRGGGAGDIEIVNGKYALLIEATLMDMNTQKRGELEPVIRHSINFSLENRNSQTIFIANELDNNVLNMFRATQFIQFNGTLNAGTVNGLNIFGMTTDEVIKILNKGIVDEDILNKISVHNNNAPIFIKNNWRDSIVREILD
ncbi:AlwI family type II restriction endonuclease [Streptococcus hyointestinalis]|nr:AlwI family type II restriction endonuclease [Streptococcus hyointestinalis]